MKRIQQIKKTVVDQWTCTDQECDLCGKKADHPQDHLWEYEFHKHQTICEMNMYSELEVLTDDVDLCPHCMKLLIEAIRSPTQSKKLLDVISPIRIDAKPVGGH